LCCVSPLCAVQLGALVPLCAAFGETILLLIYLCVVVVLLPFAGAVAVFCESIVFVVARWAVFAHLCGLWVNTV